MQFGRNDSVHLRRAVQSYSMSLYDSVKRHLTRTILAILHSHTLYLCISIFAYMLYKSSIRQVCPLSRITYKTFHIYIYI